MLKTNSEELVIMGVHRIRFLFLFLTTIGIISYPVLAQATRFEAVQGGVLRIATTLPTGEVTIKALGKRWPCVHNVDGAVDVCWIGIDLRTKAGEYPISWEHKKSIYQRDIVQVSKGKFRESYIKVKKNMANFDAITLKRIRADQAASRKSYKQFVDAVPIPDIKYMPIKGIISTPFGARRFVNGQARSPHSGVDIAAPEGTAIITPLAGEVVLSSDMYLNGNIVFIGHGAGLYSVYAHMQKADVKAGDWVEAGQRIGSVGSTGRATGPHLHWGMRFAGSRIDPRAFMVDID
ncbi:MAG: M23 family metallopeptidase [Mariprofundales bacterium]